MSNPSDIRLDEQTRNILIELVKARPVLYNDTIDRTREVIEERQQQWENIGAKLNLSAETCKVKFTNLKNNYFKNMKNHSAGPEIRRRMEFMNEFAPWNRLHTDKPARITQRRATKRPRLDYNEDSNSAIVINSSTSLSHESLPNFNGTNGTNPDQGAQTDHRIDIHNGEVYQNETPKQNGQVTERPSNSTCEISDDLTSFFKNMEHTTRKFNARLQVKVKRMISDIIYDAEEQWLNTQ